MRFKIYNHLIIPFGAPKWDISRIQITGVSTDATYFESASPIAYINKSRPRPLCLSDYHDIWQEIERIRDNKEAVVFIFRQLCMLCDDRSRYEKKWLKLYFDYHLEESEGMSLIYDEKDWSRDRGLNHAHFFMTKLPLPQAHLYLDDPLLDDSTGRLISKLPPDYMVKVDFAFWTGKEVVAVEIDGSEPSGYERDIKRDRRLRRAGVDVIHILNTEINAYGTQVIDRLLPKDIRERDRTITTDKGQREFCPLWEVKWRAPNFDEGAWIGDRKWFDDAVSDLLD